MKKILISLTLVSSLIVAGSVDITNLKWTSDFETLVNLSSSVENTLEGIDQNRNGIRDDVEYYVNHKYKNRPFQKEMFLKAAKKMQKIITLQDEKDIKTHQRLDRELLNLYTCRDYILYKLDDETLEQDMRDKVIFKGKVLNTEKRLQAYIQHKKLLPFHFDDLSDAQLEKDKTACISTYNKIKNIDKKL